MNVLKKVINVGVDDKMSLVDIGLLRLTNMINVTFIIISCITIALIQLLDVSGFKSYIRFIILIVFCLINILLNYFHRYLPAKIFTVFSPFIFVFVFPIINQFIHGGFFLWFPYGIMIIGAISFFVFSYENERIIFHCMLLFFALAAIFYDRILLNAIPNTLDLSFIYGDNYFYYLVSKVVLLFFLYSALYLSKVTTYKIRQKLIDVNIKLDQKNNELFYLNQNLENIVKQRTTQLERQNKRIKELTYSNSHKVRAYVARIIGIVNLSAGKVLKEEEKSLFDAKVKDIAHELDEETKAISKKLAEEY